MKRWWFFSVFILGVSISSFTFYSKKKIEEPLQKLFPLGDCKGYFFSVPEIPCIITQIEDQNIKSELDLGYRGTAAFSKEIIKKIRQKKLIGERILYGIKGKGYKHLRYSSPTVKINKLNFSNFIMEQESEEFLLDSKIVKAENFSSEHLGRLGWHLFENCNLFLDLANSKIAFCESAQILEKQGYPLSQFVKTSLHTERGVVEMFIPGSNDVQEMWVLDTGCTWNIMNAGEGIDSLEKMIADPNNVIARSFRIETTDFGPFVFHKIPISLPIHVDAILGVEFFKAHQVFIDFSERQIYIRKV
jgi:hypothetical protein